MKRRNYLLYLFAALFLISGAAGLIYEIVWQRLLELHFGVTMISVTLIVAAYMAGLGIGSLLGGRIARNLKNTLLWYGVLETAIALFGVASPAVIVWISHSTAGSPYALVFLISFIILLIPTALMGMTLPLLTQSFVDRVETSGQVIGVLYGINTLGAAFGCVLAGYVLIGSYGLDGTVYIAAGLNIFVGLCALALSFRKEAPLHLPPISPNLGGEKEGGWGYRTILLSSFLVGFLGLGYEMLWIRVLLIVDKNTAYAFPSILFIFLLGLALGGAIWGRRADVSSNPVLLFCKIELTGAALAVFTFLAFWLSLRFNAPWIQNFIETQKPAIPLIRINHELLFSKKILLENLWNYFLPILILVLPPSLVMGGGLPVLDRLSINNPLLSGRRVGDIHLANIIGSVAGTFIISFALLPGVGSEWTLKLLAVSTFFFPAVYFFNRAEKQSTGRNGLIALGLILFAGVVLVPGRGEFYSRLYRSGTSQEAVISESGDSVLALTYEPESSRQRGLFWIGGEVNSFFPPKGVYEDRGLVCAGASRPERILIIGFGGGYSALFYSSIPSVKEIVVVELLGDIHPFLSRNLESARLTLSDPRLTYIVDDGRRYLNASPNEKFDLISIDPLREHTAGHNNLYSEEALRLYQSHLTPNGVLCAWMRESHIIPHTVAQVFQYADQFQAEFMVASNNPIIYHTGYMDEAAADYAKLTGEIYGPALEVKLSSTSTLKSFLRDQNQILEDEKDIQTLTDMHPWLEYYLLTKPLGSDIRAQADQVVMFKSRIQR